MLEGLVAYVLNNYLGKYVENLNTDQLSIALLSGAVELENLPLKKEALRNLGLPVEIKAGFIGKVRLQVPVTQIRTASWVIAIEQLYLVAGPINIDEYDIEGEKQAFVDYKLSRLESLEARWRANMESDPGYYATSYSSWLNYGTSLVTNVIENLQLNIKDVHLRFEDAASLNGNGIAFGIMIEGLTTQSCDATLSPGATSWNTTDASYKLMELNGLSVYWNNVKKEQFYGNMNLGDLTVAMSQWKKEKWCYILSPVNAKANVKRDRSERPLRSVNRPRIIVNLSLDKVPLSLTDKQYKEIVNCIRSLENIDRQRSQRRCRPLVPVSDSPREWWIYAARCYIGKRYFKPKITWEHMIERGRNNKLYIEACVKLLSSPTSILPAEMKSVKDTMEQDRSFDELRVLREIAMYRVMPPKDATELKNGNSTQARGMLVQWFPQWWGWYSKPYNTNTQTSPSPTSSTFDGELLDALADTIDDDTLLRRDTVFGQFNFTLTKGAFSLCIVNEENQDIAPKAAMELQFEKVDLTYESRPRSGSHKFVISLGALYLHDYLTEKSTLPILIQPQTPNTGRLGGSSSELVSHATAQALFELTYEKKPLYRNFDHSLYIQSRSLEVVYNPQAIQWLVNFLCEPHRYSPHQRLQQMKRRTHRRLMKNWEQILEGDFVYRSSWDLQLNISAPQILLIEKFDDSNAAVVVVDFGRLHLSNNAEMNVLQSPPKSEDDEEYEMFETPCSTPPGSQENSMSAPIQVKAQAAISETELHNKLYDHYSIDLSDLQVLVGKVKDNWKHARTRVTSSLHLLERFNISLQIKRRVVSTADPYYIFPNVSISSILPKLVVHINEHKVHSIQMMYQLLNQILANPTNSNSDSPEIEKRREEEDEEQQQQANQKDLNNARTMQQNHAVMVQFMIDQMTFELQSRGRSVAELQVTGVKATLKKAVDLRMSLSVHGLLLVDALQEFGPDFELLIASHKHVGMDSVSGSLRDSEPTSPVSPVSPGSPDHFAGGPSGAPRRLTSPMALTHALSSLARGADPKSPFSPTNNIDGPMGLDQLDSEALIGIELRFSRDGNENLQFANIQFNNLDIIANQVTIVELVGFVKRLFPSHKSTSRSSRSVEWQESQSSLASDHKASTTTRTEITFDFHRLNVLFLRAVMQDGHLTGQKIATATMSNARIEANLSTNTFISGSLGGLQLLDQTIIGKRHQRIISVGRDPLVEDHHQPPSLGVLNQQDALEFSLQRNYSTSEMPETTVDIKIRVASVWYTHAPHLISELRSCADEFKQYLSNLARQISAAATDMAIGLVHADDWSTLPQRKRLLSISFDGCSDNTPTNLIVNLDILLESPVIVIPRSAQSLQVFVAHLGTMSLQHESSNKQKLSLEVRDMNLYSLDIDINSSQMQTYGQMPARAEEMYCCNKFGKPVLHDTMLRLEIERESTSSTSVRSPGFIPASNNNPVVQVHGVVVTPLKVSLSRPQYEQLQDTIGRLFSMPGTESAHSVQKPQNLVKQMTSSPSAASDKFDLAIKVLFELPVLSIQLKQSQVNQQPLVELSMRDLIAKYEKIQKHESTMQVSLKSLLMEDLLCPVGSKHRFMMQSSAPHRAKLRIGMSRSCPDFTTSRQSATLIKRDDACMGSLPDRLETDTLYGAIPSHWRRKHVSVLKVNSDTPNTPPPSPGTAAINSEENLVLINIITKTHVPDDDDEELSRVKLRKLTSVDFNCLDLVIRVESWMVVLDFLGVGSPSALGAQTNAPSVAATCPTSENLDDSEQPTVVFSETEIEVRSLTLVLTHTEREIAKANVSDVTVHILKECGTSKVYGSLGSLSLLDLTSHGRLYRERFLIAGRKAIHFQYLSHYLEADKRPYDAQLKLQMSAVHYVHTQRFVAELQAFFLHFSRLRTVMANLRAGRSAVINVNERSTRLSLELHAAAPIILLPVSSRSEEMILLDLGELTARNSFEFSETSPGLLLDLMNLDLVNMDVYAATRLKSDDQAVTADSLTIGSFVVVKSGHSLLTDKCHLKLRVERNLDSYLSREVPDVSVFGTLSTMDCALDPVQYMLIRGLLSYNIGENLDDLRGYFISSDTQTDDDDDNDANESNEQVWTKSYINIQLVNVTLKLHPHRGIAALACVNFIKSKLIIDSLSDGSQDIDLVSREILITDTRFNDEPHNLRPNVFSSILQPLTNDNNSTVEDRVQAEIHHRRRNNISSTTVLLHSMRVTAILDWLEAVRDFLVLKSPEPEPLSSSSLIFSSSHRGDNIYQQSQPVYPFEFKLNITDSELVLVEDTSLKDTNAVIFKCTAVMSYRSSPQEGEKTLTCNLSHCELFSCILGFEEETALSIIDPVGASLEINCDKCLEIQLQPLCVRLSYHDVNMFTRMLDSLPKQTLWAKQKSSSSPVLCSPESNELIKTQQQQVGKLSALGFNEADCEIALDNCNGHLDDAALWLTQNAVPNDTTAAAACSGDQPCFKRLELETACLRICIIDDCRDADVPLLELTLSDLNLTQHRTTGSGSISATFGVDYYNRVLSGWEPFIEPWRATVNWNQALASNLTQKRMQINVDSQDSVNVNVTYTLVKLVSLVKENWTQDYHSKNYSTKMTNNGQQEYRRRSPFIPFALKNETGSILWFKTFISGADDLKESERGSLVKLEQRDETWLEVPIGQTVPFTFEGRGKMRHHSTHIVRRHQVAVLIDGMRLMEPVSVDKVGVYFRNALIDTTGSEVPNMKARVIFNVELEGSARKLVTIRSALQIVNKLNYPVEIKMVKSLSQFRYFFSSTSGSGRILKIPAHSELSVAITHTDMDMSLRPVQPERTFQYCTEMIHWSIVKKPLEVKEIFISCRDNQNNFFRVTVAIKRDNYPMDINDIPGHTITILAPITVTNLLPHEIMYKIGKDNGNRVPPGSSSDLHSYNADETLEITVQVEGYPGVGMLLIPQYSTSFTSRLRLLDSLDRVLFLQATVVVEKGAAIKVNITAPYWIINKTGLPLVFRQEGVGSDFAGQFEEHEKARMVAPLLFSFSDEEASRSIAVRIGTGIHPQGVPQWSQHFHLHPGIQVQRLRVTLRDNRPELVYLVGVTTRMAKGRYRATTVVTLSPRYQLHNRSSTTLELAQKCFTTTVSHPDAQATYITATPNCHMPFHWPRLDKDQLLCVRILDVSDCMWSGGITLQGNHSLTINIRNTAGRMHFLRVDVVLRESTYFIVFTDANTMPPPIRVDNFSEVPLNINQALVPESLQWTVRPHTSVPYALDESSLPATLIVAAPGGIMSTHDLNLLGDNKVLTYENFIYIAFTGTFKTNGDLGTGENTFDPLDVETQRLVLEAGSGGWVALKRQQPGNRAQLWRMTSEGQLQHEGSSPPRDEHSRSSENVLVLDIAGTAPQPFSYCTLALRRPDQRRKSTQTWRFTDEGRLCCAHKNMCVQSKDGFMGLHEGSEAVLGPQTHGEVPIAQRVGRMRLRPGSGFLSVQVTTDGPTRVLQILDMNERKKPFALLEERDWSNIAVAQRPNQMYGNGGGNNKLSYRDARELELSVKLVSGLGLSIVSHRPVEELLFARFAGICLELNQNSQRSLLDLKIEDVQIDNQLFEAQCTSVLYISRPTRTELDSRPAIHLQAEKLPTRNQNAEIYRQLLVTVKPVCIYLEERLILKLAAFVGVGRSELDAPVDENEFNAQRFIYDVSAASAKRYYFGTLKLVPSQVTLSVLTTTKLAPHLQSIKKKLGLMLIKFEGATIELEPFIRTHPFESQQFLIHSIVKHYKDELKWQAATILGSVDFLGNPMGFVADVTEGFSGLFYEGSVKTLIKNLTHGVTNSTAKFAGSLSDGLGRVIMDERHEEARQRIRITQGKSMDHFMAGVKGLGFGLIGGLTSIIQETYDGATNEGFPGFVAGFGKGVVGTVTKPVVGILDFATEAATAVRETSKSTHQIIPKRDRLPRVASGPAGLLPPYNHEQSEGQEFLYSINDRDYTELFVAYECLRSGSENLRMLVSNERIRIISGGTTKDVVTEMNLADLLHCQPTHKIESNGSLLHYIQLTCRADSIKAVTFDGHEALKCPKVRCDNEDVAKWVSQQINYAKSMYEERCLTLSSSDNILDDIHNYK